MKKNNNGLKKTLILGTLALAISIPTGVGAASAASVTGTNATKLTQTQLTQMTSRLGIDLNALLQQLLQGQYPVVTNPSTGTSNPGHGQPSVPSQPSQPSTPSVPSTPSQPSTGNGNNGNTGAEVPDSSFATQVVTLVNQERAKAGLGALKMSNATLNKMAMDKAKDMYNNGYFDHNSPTYGSPFDMMKQYGINFSYAGENIAKGQRTPQEVMTAWMNSSGHRANILGANFTTIGVAYYNGVWVQEFIS
ncbi:CAP domain-containing protein [Cohnella lupini]|uniref:Putative YkwD family protein n=1 Tax=Cohnella lupini TaxID=1294267 RepID=A0A3D9ITK5_9BACL|nr:CAP domain-containing protein [Cohnella lupini]RED65101.1 putative YkwD family protein [Cohnella lupini]